MWKWWIFYHTVRWSFGTITGWLFIRPLVRIPTSNGASRDVNQDPPILRRVFFHCATQVSVLYNFVFAYFTVEYCRSIYHCELVWYCKNKSKIKHVGIVHGVLARVTIKYSKVLGSNSDGSFGFSDPFSFHKTFPKPPFVKNSHWKMPLA